MSVLTETDSTAQDLQTYDADFETEEADPDYTASTACKYTTYLC